MLLAKNTNIICRGDNYNTINNINNINLRFDKLWFFKVKRSHLGAAWWDEQLEILDLKLSRPIRKFKLRRGSKGQQLLKKLRLRVSVLKIPQTTSMCFFMFFFQSHGEGIYDPQLWQWLRVNSQACVPHLSINLGCIVMTSWILFHKWFCFG